MVTVPCFGGLGDRAERHLQGLVWEPLGVHGGLGVWMQDHVRSLAPGTPRSKSPGGFRFEASEVAASEVAASDWAASEVGSQ